MLTFNASPRGADGMFRRFAEFASTRNQVLGVRQARKKKKMFLKNWNKLSRLNGDLLSCDDSPCVQQHLRVCVRACVCVCVHTVKNAAPQLQFTPPSAAYRAYACIFAT